MSRIRESYIGRYLLLNGISLLCLDLKGREERGLNLDCLVDRTQGYDLKGETRY